MTENSFQLKLAELRTQFHALQVFSQEDPGQSGELLPKFLVGLDRSLEELESSAALLAQNVDGGSNGSARGNGQGHAPERRRSLERVQESEARKAAIIDALLDAVITVDQQALVVEFNCAAETIFGYQREAIVGRELLGRVVPLRLREQAQAAFQHFQATEKSELLGKRFETIAMRSDGSEIPVEVALAPIGVGGHPLLTIYVCDLTARKAAEQTVKKYQVRLRSLMADLLLAEERERRRLATDLHDGLSQTIALAQIKLASLRRSLGGKMGQALDQIEGLIEQANGASRSIGFELSPPVLHDLGLEPAVQWLVENIQSRYGIEIVMQDDGRPKPADEKTRVILYRSIRELLINAAKHAGARHVNVRLELDGDRLHASVEDDGIGMDPRAAGAEGSGLFSIRERISHVGGSMHIDSSPGRGTKIRLCTPLSTTSLANAETPT